MSNQYLDLFLCGDVMTGRGVDQIMPNPNDPRLFERSVRDAREYVRLAEAKHGRIEQPVDYGYIWGEALSEFDRRGPRSKIINLETAITTNDEPWPGKAVHYRMHPGNGSCLIAADIDCVTLANNHVLDWGRKGLQETLESLSQMGMKSCGAGVDRAAAERPAVFNLGDRRRLLVFSAGSRSSGIPAEWAAEEDRAGVFLIDEDQLASLDRLVAVINRYRQSEDVVVVSIHWGSNWGYQVSAAQQRLAHQVIERAGVSIVHGHSSHHVKGLGMYQGRLILYGCGDLLTDYEGIKSYHEYRDDCGLMYFPRLDLDTGSIAGLTMVPTRLRGMRIDRPTDEEIKWLASLVARESEKLGADIQLTTLNTLKLAASASRNDASTTF